MLWTANGCRSEILAMISLMACRRHCKQKFYSHVWPGSGTRNSARGSNNPIVHTSKFSLASFNLTSFISPCVWGNMTSFFVSLARRLACQRLNKQSETCPGKTCHVRKLPMWMACERIYDKSSVWNGRITNSRTQMLKMLKLLFPQHAMQACGFYLVLVPCVLFDVKEFGKAIGIRHSL